ncbi:MAG TPA: hypothetical protein VHV55_22815 [Pirellulales bacterium]|jgi:hypothetical protein|nr:hypothetical protein [Pirellulales bacterium]
MTPAEAVRAAVADIESLPAAVRGQTRYLQLTTADEAQCVRQAKAISFLLNSISRARPLALPVRVEDGGRLVRVDLASYADFKKPGTYQELFGAWEKLAETDPYFHLRTQVLAAGERTPRTVTTDGGWVDVAAAARLKQMSTSFGAVLRADYFVSRVAGGAYYGWAGVPAKEEDYFKQFGVDAVALGSLAADSAANLLRSGVTRKPRRIIQRPGAFGGVWQSKDVDAESPDRDPLRNPVDIDLGKGATQKFNFQASEIFALGANRLWRVAVFDAAGNRTDVVPDKVAKDYTGDGIIRPMLTCLRCHERNGGTAGLQPFHDDQTDLIASAGIKSYLPEVAQRLAELYDNPALGRAMTRDREDFAAAVAGATGGMTPAQAVDALSSMFAGYADEQVTPERAAGELGIAPAQLTTVLAHSTDPIALALATGKAVNRAAWESCFAEIALRAAKAANDER